MVHQHPAEGGTSNRPGGIVSGKFRRPALFCAWQHNLVCELPGEDGHYGVYGRRERHLKTIGLISDTHGLLRPEAIRALAGVGHIIHAGDIGAPEILDTLRAIAPTHAVRGNNDKAAWAAEIPLVLALALEGANIHVLHDVKELDIDPRAGGFDIVVSGHSHKPAVTERDGVHFINPGSAGPRRFRLPVTIAYLDITTTGPRARIVAIL